MSLNKNTRLKPIKRRLLLGLQWSMLLLIMHGAKVYNTDIVYRGEAVSTERQKVHMICLPP